MSKKKPNETITYDMNKTKFLLEHSTDGILCEAVLFLLFRNVHTRETILLDSIFYLFHRLKLLS